MDKRAHERSKTHLNAQIIIGNEMASTIDCIVRNMSEGGALIEVGEATSVPAAFDLRFIRTGKSQSAAVRWRDANRIGVEFVSSSQSSSIDNAIADLERILPSMSWALARGPGSEETSGLPYSFIILDASERPLGFGDGPSAPAAIRSATEAAFATWQTRKEHPSSGPTSFSTQRKSRPPRKH